AGPPSSGPGRRCARAVAAARSDEAGRIADAADLPARPEDLSSPWIIFAGCRRRLPARSPAASPRRRRAGGGQAPMHHYRPLLACAVSLAVLLVPGVSLALCS